ncbi:phage holin family protein [Paludicola sp. MB14-C6]|uniref:phage holin family protein n=1 Tax=Paludihabitans sp. MB14-C6 TaxID=3070656 RepID=UPI0027DAFD25|nr:phage holin family protein [Paludicola sp. MB14-C6]WMJ23448.1 phage holin family protein [Paludicola sp. MB14-C6]
MQDFLMSILRNPFIQAAAIMIIFDTILGLLRAGKEKRFNSSAGINGAIRKVGMLVCIIILAFVDLVVHIDLLFMIPKEYLQVIGIQKLGLCEFFALLFTVFEFISVLKNMVLCGIPVPKKLKEWLMKFLSEMTSELPVSQSTAIVQSPNKTKDEIDKSIVKEE